MPITAILQLRFANACKEIRAGLRLASLDTDNNESLRQFKTAQDLDACFLAEACHHSFSVLSGVYASDS